MSSAMNSGAGGGAEASAVLESSSSAMNVVVRKKAHLGIPSKASIVIHRKERVKEGSFVDKLHGFVIEPKVEFLLHSLLILDVLIIFAELFIVMEYPKCYLIKRDCIACCPGEGGDGIERFLAGGGGSGHSSEYGFCDDGYEETGEAACDEYKRETAMMVKNVLFWITVCILAVFLLEGIVEMLALGRLYFKQVFLVLDFVIVFVSLTLELFFHFWTKKDGFDYERAFSLFIMIRLWRFVRIGHGAFEAASEVTSKSYQPLFAYID